MYSHTHLQSQIIWQPMKQVLSVKCPTSKPQCIVDYSNVNVWWNITTLLIKGANFNNKFLTLTMGLRESIQIMPNRWHRLGDFFQMLLNCSLSSKIETYRHMKLRDNPPPLGYQIPLCVPTTIRAQWILGFADFTLISHYSRVFTKMARFWSWLSDMDSLIPFNRHS